MKIRRFFLFAFVIVPALFVVVSQSADTRAQPTQQESIYIPPGIKTVTPTGQVNYGDELTYTLVISAAPGTQVGLYDPLEGTTWITFTEQPAGVAHANGVITGTLTLTPTHQITVSFIVRTSIPITAGQTTSVTNRACIYPFDGTLGGCFWTNEVTNPVFRPYNIYLPLVFRRWPPIPYTPILSAIDDVNCGNYTMRWTESPERLAITYTVQEATDPIFTIHPNEVCIAQAQSCAVYDKPGGTYYYRVRGHNAWGYGEWSNVESVQVLSPLYVTPSDFRIQGDEFFLDTRYGAIPCIPTINGVDLNAYILEMTFQVENGRQAQLYFKNQRWANVYSQRKEIKNKQPVRFDPIHDPCDVCEFRDFTHIYAIGAKILGGTQGVTITSARLVRR